jgi:DNA ligase (NAD+)
MTDEVTDEVLDLRGKRVVFTGVLDMPREELWGYAESELGAICQKAITSETDYLIVGEKPGASKLSKAERWGVKIVSREQWENL